MSNEISFIRINAVAKYNRHDAIDDAKQIITTSGGWVTDYRMFSNRSLCIQFEIEWEDAFRLYSAIQLTPMKLTEETQTLLEQLANQTNNSASSSKKDIRGTLQVTMIHDEPDMIIEVPPLEL
ncbi:hypothetical protein [Paenibacillus glycanilyticus]|uniref:Uncharacterized protein n=1 Tax=Paenibacillus glycanilyticus TaxID=126569 RepID=A0ABQ6GBJ1_9BACL|nr:hypothetical protein [Paenibacillus glycanilyticus]GLX66633.1 hypothetical protein MU1_09770 [Paenibacillus glycanilyticus]